MTAKTDAQAVRAVVDAYESAVKRSDVQAYVSLFDDDVIWAGPRRSPAKSKAAIEASVSESFTRGTFDPKIEIERLDVLGDIALIFAHLQGRSVLKESGESMPMDYSVLYFCLTPINPIGTL
ncbi:MAG: SgcJ/EcaC family oxidoreductase [Deltaproteobacteria bacterium]|nr:SgcJ/EcaC family oxidoreductase [Deltaproteobacteria bacterium]